jgi:uncharacterized membrane protein YdjX (TVP38/TMEM64 family)
LTPSKTSPFVRFLSGRWRRLPALVIWLALIGTVLVTMRANQTEPVKALHMLVVQVQGQPWAPLAFILLYALRPLMLFSASVFSMVGGLVFGPVWGLVYSLIGANLSGWVAYSIAAYFGEGVADPDRLRGIAARFAGRMHRAPMLTVATMRLLFIPFDAVAFLSGALRIPRIPFHLGTFIGSLPGALLIVFTGATIGERVAGESAPSQPWGTVAAVIIFGFGLLLGRYGERMLPAAGPDRNLAVREQGD